MNLMVDPSFQLIFHFIAAFVPFSPETGLEPLKVTDSALAEDGKKQAIIKNLTKKTVGQFLLFQEYSHGNFS